MNPARVQEIHQAMYLHFTSERYNFLEYNGKLRSPKATHFSERLAKQLDDEPAAIEFFLSNQIAFFQESNKANSFIGNFCTNESMTTWKKYLGYKENFSYNLLGELKTLISLGEKIKNFSEICNLLLRKKVGYITVANFMKHTKLEEEWKTDDPLLEQIYNFVLKVSHFVMIPKKNFKEAIQKAAAEL